MPGDHVRRLPRTWWLHKRTYFLFMLRELTSVFVFGYAIFLVVLIARAGDPASFQRFHDGLANPWSVVLHLLALAMVLFHTITWISLTPKVLVLWRGEDRVSPGLIATTNYLMWLIVSGVVAWVALG